MAEFALTDFDDFAPDILIEKDFGQEINRLRLINRSYYPIKIFFQKSTGVYNDEPTILPADETRNFPFILQKFKYIAKNKAKISIIGFIGAASGGGTVEDVSKTKEYQFDHTGSYPLSIRGFLSGEKLLKVELNILSGFDSGLKIKVGFPANNGEVFKESDVNPSKIGLYSVDVHKTFTVDETLMVYFDGDPTVGSACLTVYYLEA